MNHPISQFSFFQTQLVLRMLNVKSESRRLSRTIRVHLGLSRALPAVPKKGQLPQGNPHRSRGTPEPQAGVSEQVLPSQLTSACGHVVSLRADPPWTHGAVAVSMGSGKQQAEGFAGQGTGDGTQPQSRPLPGHARTTTARTGANVFKIGGGGE